jgi:hypothetical protein
MVGGGAQADLAVGVPGEDVGALASAGAVNVLSGSLTGLTDTSNQLWHQDSSLVLDASERGDQVGLALTGGSFGKTAEADLVLGAPSEDVGLVPFPVTDAGAVNVVYGAAASLTATGNQFWNQNSAGILDAAEPGDLFGWSAG